MQRFKNILFVALPNSTNERALERAVKLADNNQARLTVVDVIDKIPLNVKLPSANLSSADLQAILVKEHLNRLQTLISPWRADIEIHAEVHTGIHFLEIIRDVLRNGRDLVVKTAENDSFLDQVFGSDDMHLLRKCPCPVWLFKPDLPVDYKRILAAVDTDSFYSEDGLNNKHALNCQVLEMAISLAISEFAELHIVCVWHAIGESAMRGALMKKSEDELVNYVEEIRLEGEHNLKALLDEVIGKMGQNTLEYLNPHTHLVKGFPRKEIPAFADKIEADLIIMGTVARTGIPGFFMGNTAEAILNHIHCSVIALKPPGFATPVTFEN